MKKYLILLGCLLSVQLWGHTPILDSYPLPEMEALGFPPYPPHAQQIVDVYLVDEETWQKRLADAKKRFDEVKAQEKTEGYSIEVLRQYWNLSISYDYALANDEVYSIFLGCIEESPIEKNMDWAMAFDSIHPTHLNDMRLNRVGYLREPEAWRADAAALTMERDHSDHSDYTAPHDGASSSRPSTVHTHPSSGEHTSDDEAKPLVDHATGRATAYRVETDPYKPKSTDGLRKRKVTPQ
jgi:hypothetical protein